MIKKMSCLILSLIMVLSLCACQKKSKDEQLLFTPFIMEVYKTHMNGAYYDTYPNKVFETDELFNLLNSASGEGPFNDNIEKQVYIIDMVNGIDYSTFTMYNNGKIELKYNFLFYSEFYLTEKQFNEVVKLLES